MVLVLARRNGINAPSLPPWRHRCSIVAVRKRKRAPKGAAGHDGAGGRSGPAGGHDMSAATDEFAPGESSVQVPVLAHRPEGRDLTTVPDLEPPARELITLAGAVTDDMLQAPARDPHWPGA
jgi:hypothetical protein